MLMKFEQRRVNEEHCQSTMKQKHMKVKQRHVNAKHCQLTI
jgi:hypothetical protein